MFQQMVRHTISWGTIVILIVGALGLGYLAYRRIGAPPQLLRGAVAVEGVITEKVIDKQVLNPLSISVPVYIVRYAFPTTFGQMRTGQQTVTRAAYTRVGRQGSPVQVVISPNDAGINAVDARITFPAGAGIRLVGAVGCLIIAYVMLVLEVMQTNRNKKISSPSL